MPFKLPSGFASKPATAGDHGKEGQAKGVHQVTDDRAIIHVVSADSSRGDLWAEVQRQSGLIGQLKLAVEAHAQSIRDKEAVIQYAVAEVWRLRNALLEFARQNCEVGLQTMRIKHGKILARADLAITEPKP